MIDPTLFDKRLFHQSLSYSFDALSSRSIRTDSSSVQKNYCFSHTQGHAFLPCALLERPVPSTLHSLLHTLDQWFFPPAKQTRK
jgi:hypothetical protein